MVESGLVVARKTRRAGIWRRQGDAGFRPRKPISGIGVERSLPRDLENSRNAAVITAQTMWLPTSSRAVSQQSLSRRFL